MKAERRHELQTNTLAQALAGAPAWWQKYGGRVLFLLIAAVLAVILIRFRVSSGRAAEQAAQQNLAVARTLIDELDNFNQLRGQPDQMTIIREDASRALESATGGSDTPATQAEVLVARGDLYWTLASIPKPPASTQPSATQPAQPERSPEQLIDEAARAYQAVLDQFGNEKHAAVAARMGLAAIAENRGNWDVAREHYEAVARDETLAQAYRGHATRRLEQLPQLQKPILIVAPAPATQPTTQTADAGAGAGAADLSALLAAQPVEPDTNPATRPATPPTTAPAAPAAR
jgi:hypothetical protein